MLAAPPCRTCMKRFKLAKAIFGFLTLRFLTPCTTNKVNQQKI